MSGIKNVFRLIGLLWLVGVIAIGIGGTWLEHHPESAVKVALAASDDPRVAVAMAAIDATASFRDSDHAQAPAKAKTVAEQWSRDRAEDEAAQARRERSYGY